MKASWNDIEKALNSDTLEENDKATLEAFLRIEPPPRNPASHARFADAKQHIRHRLFELAASEVKADLPHAGMDGASDAGQWFVQVMRLTREIRGKALDAQKSKSKATVTTLKG